MARAQRGDRRSVQAQATSAGRPRATAWRSVTTLLAALVCLGAARAAQEPRRPETGDGSLRILFGGDVYFGEVYAELPVVGKRCPPVGGHGDAITDLLPLFRGADGAVVNLEAPLTHDDDSPWAGRKDYLHRGHPEATLQALRSLGVTAVGLANNHAMDFGEAGLRDTLGAFRHSGIGTVGAGANERQAASPWVQRWLTPTGPCDLAVVAGYEHNRRYDETYDAYAEAGDEGVNLWTPDLATHQVRQLREACPRAFIVAFAHGGENYQWRDARQAELHRCLALAGADLVVGHGSHMAQEVEHYQDRWLVHGLGNLVFSTPGRYGDLGQHAWSLVLALHADALQGGTRWHLRLYPILSDNQLTCYRPRPANQAEAEAVGRLLATRSGHNTDPRWRPRYDGWGWHYRLETRRADATRPDAAGDPGATLRRGPPRPG